MAPVANSELKDYLQQMIDENRVMIFSKTTCPFCAKVKELFKSLNVTFEAFELDEQGESYFRSSLKSY